MIRSNCTLLRRLFLLVALGLSAGRGIAGEVETGKVLDKVTCAADETQTYALYLPSNFDTSRRWPVIFCFDPGARGQVPVERFKAAAEKYGYIVAGSNNSRNGPWAANVTAINAMMRDVSRGLPVDAKRMYAAGLSGGARVACQMAVDGVVDGVISCSAAFNGDGAPRKVPFPLFGTAGVTDFNYGELRRTDRELDDARAVHRIVIHDGGHEWLSAALAEDALAWLELQAMRSGTKPRDDAWINAQFAARLTAVPVQPLAENFRELKSIAADFKGVADTTALETKIAGLAAMRTVREALKAEQVAEKRESEWAEGLMDAVQEGAMKDVRKRAADLHARADAAGDSAQRQMAARALQGVYSGCSERARSLVRSENFAQAAQLFEAMLVLRPERLQTWFDFSRSRALSGDKKAALAALNAAAAAGFKDADRVEAEPAFGKWRADPAYISALAAMK